MDAFMVTFFLLTAAGFMILLFCRAPADSPVLPANSERVTMTKNRPRPVAPLLLSTSRAGDADRTLIWSTQIPALRFVCQHEPQGTSCADLKPIYLKLARRYPEIYDGHTFHEWGQLLVDLDLLRVEAKRIHITPSGHALLKLLAGESERQAHEAAWQ